MQRALSLNCTSRSTCWSYCAPSWNPTAGLGCSQVSQWFWPPTWQHHGYASTSHHVAPSPSMLTALSCTDFGIGLVVFMGYTRNEYFSRNMVQTQALVYMHAHSPLCNSTPVSISKRLSRTILKIDEVTATVSLSTGTSLAIETIAPVNCWNKSKKYEQINPLKE